MLSTEEKEVWMMAYCAVLSSITTNYAGGELDKASNRAYTLADKSLKHFKKRFDAPGNYREPAK